MDRFNADFRQLDALNIAKLAKPLPSRPPGRKPLNETEANVLTSVSVFGEMLGVPAAGLITELSKIPKAPPAVTIAPPKSVPFGFAGAPRPAARHRVAASLIDGHQAGSEIRSIPMAVLVREGSTGEPVKKLQTMLNFLGAATPR